MPTVPLQLPRQVVDDVLATIVECGGGRNECVVYVTGPVGLDGRATAFIHPEHDATAVSTEVDGAALDRVWDVLRERRERIVLQVHSHPGGAHHSGIDDGWPVVHRVGFPSLVVARFGTVGLQGAHLAIHLGGGVWRGVELAAWNEYLVVDGTRGRPQRGPGPTSDREGRGVVHPL